MTSDLSELAPEFLASLASQGLSKQYNLTWAVVVNIDAIGHERHYCYEHASEAAAALDAWDGGGHPSGPWITKYKGANATCSTPSSVESSWATRPDANHGQE